MITTMNIEQQLLKEHSKRQTEKIARWIGTDETRLNAFLDVFLHGEPLVVQRGAWVIGKLGDRHPNVFVPHLSRLIKKMQEPGVHDAVRRNVVRLLQTIEIPRRLLGIVVSLCFDYLESPAEPIAVKVFAMSVIARVAKTEPDLERELRLIVRQQLPQAGGAFRSRARSVLHETAPSAVEFD